MKKVLIIMQFNASPRMSGLAKYLPEFGWEPIIITIKTKEKPAHVRIIETPFRDAMGFWKKVLGFNTKNELNRMQVKNSMGIFSTSSFIDFFIIFCAAITTYPDTYRGWKPFAIKAANELLQYEKIDAIISSSSPITAHLIAKELKNKHKIPWIADLRDLWSQNHNYGYGPIRKLIDRRLELKTLASADALVTVSCPWAEKLSMLHKGKATYTITNGFDPVEMEKIPQSGLTPKFTITYTGKIYAGKQDPSKLFAALKDLISHGFIDLNKVEVRFYGNKEGWLQKEIEEYDLSAIVKQYGIVPRDIAFKKQRESQILLLLNWETQVEKGWHPLKGFEYLAAQRPILAIGGYGNDVTEKLINETKAGTYAPSVEDIKNILRELYSEYKCKGKISYNGESEKINKYSYREMARKFAEILDSLT